MHSPLVRLLRDLRRAVNEEDLAEANRLIESLEAEITTGFTAAYSARLLDLGRLAAELAHEMRQPLMGVKAYAQMIEGMASDPAKIVKRAQAIVTQASRMEHLLGRVSAYARGGALEGQPNGCDLNEVLDAAVDLLRVRSRKWRIRLEMKQAPSPLLVCADPAGIQQIFVNLLGNAFEAIGENSGEGVIHVATSNVNGYAEAIIEDNGPGVHPEQREHLFEPFITTKPSGTGLGLSISRQIAEKHGGSIVLMHSEIGARFRVRLPLDRALRQHAADPSG